METSKPTTELVTKKMQGLKATMMMIAAQLAIAAITVAYKLAANDGMHMRIMVFYRYLFGSKQKTEANMENTRPSFCLRNFWVKIGTKGGKAKVIGTLVGVVGAMVLTFYKGHQLNIWSTHVNILHGGQHMHGQYVAATQKTSIHQTVGSLLGLASSLSIALYLSLQGRMSANYPCHYSGTFLFIVMGLIQSFVFTLCTERSWSEWKLGWNIRLFAALFTAIASSLSIIFITTSVHLQGPLFVSNFNPLMLVFVAIAGSLVLDEKLHVGSVVGSIIIVAGLYVMLWGRSNMNRLSKQMPVTCSENVNDVLNNNNTTITPTRTSFLTTNENNELPILSTRVKEKEQEVTEE
ncbi:WAT1-related protein At1g68170-like [Cynara cardunculus var. scolymus]|uniref:WAT1-related protein At1g68170-like n=1 Tax=Cynara cardunculus var. scolymus TaxID=59895 RepID=UPI000D629D14|nr:WAT1-related protein At1g68170-like [Cynara cardunculus var. scolymus]